MVSGMRVPACLTLGGPSGILKDGKPCLTVTVQGYYTVYAEGAYYLLHRLVWQLVHGEIPENLVVDHKDGNRLNNDIGNLRIVTRQQNNQNTSGARVHKHGASWRVQVKFNGELFRKGRFKTQEEASEFAELLSKELKGEFHR